MAEEKVDEKSSSAEPGSKKKNKLMLGGGFVGIIAAGAIAAMVALPGKMEKRTFAGPFSLSLFEEQFSCNIEQGRTRFLQMSPVANYFSYDPLYMQARVSDELYKAELQTTVFNISSRKSLDDIYGEVNKETFMEELRDALDPVLFPVHIGDSKLPWDFDTASGLRPGISSNKNSFRGRSEDHILHVNQPTSELWIDDGPKTEFIVGELDARVFNTDGEVVYIDVSGVKEGFSGELSIGAQGMIIRILPVGLLVQ